MERPFEEEIIYCEELEAATFQAVKDSRMLTRHLFDYLNILVSKTELATVLSVTSFPAR